VGIRGPIILRQPFGAASSIDGDDYLEAEEVPGAIDALRRLSTELFFCRVYFVVKFDSVPYHNRIVHWLKHREVFRRTGIPQDNVLYCKQEMSVPDCCMGIGTTHLVYSQLASLKQMMMSGVRLYAFNPHPQDEKRHAYLFVNRAQSFRPGRTSSPPRSLKLCRTWNDVLTDLNLGANP
jgi:hypothetical protein